MDPSPLADTEWSDIGQLLTGLWIIVGLVVFLASNVLIGHIFIPSLVASSHLPNGFQRTRPAFYAMAVVALALVVTVLVRVIDLANVVERFWADYWI